LGDGIRALRGLNLSRIDWFHICAQVRPGKLWGGHLPGWSRMRASLFERHREVSSSTFCSRIPAAKWEPFWFPAMNEISSASGESSPLNPHRRTLASVDLALPKNSLDGLLDKTPKTGS